MVYNKHPKRSIRSQSPHSQKRGSAYQTSRVQDVQAFGDFVLTNPNVAPGGFGCGMRQDNKEIQ